MRTPTVCAVPGCPQIRPCPTHPARLSRSRGWAWSTLIVPAVLSRDGHRCVFCGRPCPHDDPTVTAAGHHDVDHRTPRAEGGTDDMSNLRTVCASRNRGGTCR